MSRRDRTTARRVKSWLDSELGPRSSREVSGLVRRSVRARSLCDDYRRISRAIREAGERLPLPRPRCADAILRSRRERKSGERQLIRSLQRTALAAGLVLASTLAVLASSAPSSAPDHVSRSTPPRVTSLEPAPDSSPARSLDLDQALAWSIATPTWVEY